MFRIVLRVWIFIHVLKTCFLRNGFSEPFACYLDLMQCHLLFQRLVFLSSSCCCNTLFQYLVVVFLSIRCTFASMCLLLLLLLLLPFPVAVCTELRRSKRAPAGLASHCGPWSEGDRNPESALGGICLLPPPMERSRHTEARRGGRTKNSCFSFFCRGGPEGGKHVFLVLSSSMYRSYNFWPRGSRGRPGN